MKFIQTLKNIWKIEELKNRILVTLGLLLVYRFGAQVVLPGIDADQLGQFSGNFAGGGIGGLLDAFTGGAFSNASIFALGIMPYISASIVVQLMGIAIPYLQKLQKDGESGRRKINQITRWLTIAICLVQAPGYLASLPALGVPTEAFVLGLTFQFYFTSVYDLLVEIASEGDETLSRFLEKHCFNNDDIKDIEVMKGLATYKNQFLLKSHEKL